MSWNPSLEPGCPDAVGIDAIETLIVPRARDLGGFEVRRALPAPKRQMVGPFVFFDQAGPAEFVTGKGVDVRPHPHIGLGTVTYLCASLSVQVAAPGGTYSGASTMSARLILGHAYGESWNPSLEPGCPDAVGSGPGTPSRSQAARPVRAWWPWAARP